MLPYFVVMSFKVYGRGTGADCRNHVQRLNTMRGKMAELKELVPQETAEEEEDSGLQVGPSLTLKAPIATKVVCFSRLLKSLRCLYGKQCGPRSDCSYRSSLFWVHAVCFYT